MSVMFRKSDTCCWLSHTVFSLGGRKLQASSPIFVVYQVFPIWSKIVLPATYVLYLQLEQTGTIAAERSHSDHQPSGTAWHLLLRLPFNWLHLITSKVWCI